MGAHTITFFKTDNCERQALEPISQEAIDRGYKVKFSDDSRQVAEIGFYCEHLARPNAQLSVVMLHDLAQSHHMWPNFWAHEPWNAYDIGLLPGPFWSRMWQPMKNLRMAQPRYGVYEVGWPKADRLIKNIPEHKSQVATLRDELQLKYDTSVVYAPSWENDQKQSEFVNALLHLPVNLLLKQAPWSDKFNNVLDAIGIQNKLHENISEKVRIIDPEISIMSVFGISDLLVSDESSVLYEACLADVPSLAVTDWTIPDTDPPRHAIVPFKEINKTTKNELAIKVSDMLRNLEFEKQKCLRFRELFYSDLGVSSQKIMDLIDGVIEKKELVFSPIG